MNNLNKRGQSLTKSIFSLSVFWSSPQSINNGKRMSRIARNVKINRYLSFFSHNS